MNRLKLGILGNGYLAEIIADAWKNGLLDEYELVGIAGRTEEKTAALCSRYGCRPCHSAEELMSLEPDYVAEAASVAAVKENGEMILSGGANLVVLSIGAFADKEFYQRMIETAKASHRRIHIASGAVGGFDVLRTVSLMGQVKGSFRTEKGPGSLRNTPIFTEDLMTDTEKSHVFDGNATQAIALLPTKVNVAVASSLAMAGTDETKVDIYSVPGFVGDDHKITAEIDGVKAVVDIYSSTSAIAGWSVVAALRNIVSPVAF